MVYSQGGLAGSFLPSVQVYSIRLHGGIGLSTGKGLENYEK